MGEAGAAAAEKLIKRFATAAETGAKVKIDKGILKQLAAAGVSAAALAEQLGVTPEKLNGMTIDAQKMGEAMQAALIKKGKGPLEAMGLTWDVIGAKLRDGFEDLFEDLGPFVQPLMAAIKSLFGEFSAGSTMATGAKSVVVSAMEVLLAVATKVVNGIHLGGLQIYIAWLKVKMAIAPVTSAIASLIPQGTAMTVLIYIVKGLAVVFGILAVAIFIAFLPLIILVAAIVAVGVAIYAIGEAIFAAIGWLADLGSGAIDAAANFIGGLVSGIASGAGAVVDAVKALASSAIGALKGALGIASDSKIAIGVAGHTTSGLAHGLEKGQEDVEAAAKGTGDVAARGLAEGADGAPGAKGKAGGKAAGGGVTVIVEKGAVVVQGAGGDVLQVTEEAIALLFERVALREAAL